MPLNLLPIAVKIGATFAPRLIRWIAGDDAGDVAEEVVDAARSVAGVDDPEEALREIQADPQMRAALIAKLEAIELAKLEQQTAQLRELQATRRLEIVSNDQFVRRARPTALYVACALFLMFGVTGLIGVIGGVIAALMGDGDAATILFTGSSGVIGNLVPVAIAAGTVGGWYVHKRSQDKAVSEGHAPTPSLFGDFGRAVVARVSPNRRDAATPPPTAAPL